MPTSTNPRAVASPPGDLTAKARIRNAALHLLASHGEAGTSMRAIATAAGVTVGLVVHHFSTKDALIRAVEGRIVEQFAEAIASAPVEDSSTDVVAARDAAVARMLATQPDVVSHLRRALLDGRRREGDLLERLAELTAQQVMELRAQGLASNRSSVATQVNVILVRQLGRLLLQPLVERVSQQFGESHSPELVVGLRGWRSAASSA